MQDSQRRRILTAFDQAAQRGLPVSRIVSGLSLKFDLRPSRVLEVLRQAQRVGVQEVLDGVVAWPSGSLRPLASRSLEREVEAAFVQAATDYAVMRGWLDAEELSALPPEAMLRQVSATIAARLSSRMSQAA